MGGLPHTRVRGVPRDLDLAWFRSLQCQLIVIAITMPINSKSENKKKIKSEKNLPAISKKITPSDILNAIDFDELCDQVVRGATYQKIADSLGVKLMTLYDWVHRDRGRSVKFARASYLSSEAWHEKGRDMIVNSLAKSGDIDPSAARAYAQECARLALIRSRNFREKQQDIYAENVDVQHVRDHAEIKDPAELLRTIATDPQYTMETRMAAAEKAAPYFTARKSPEATQTTRSAQDIADDIRVALEHMDGTVPDEQ